MSEPVANRPLDTRLFTRPLPLMAMAVLVLNDHVFKGAGLLPGWLTGKLSDVTGLFFAPLLLCEGMLLVFGVRSQAHARHLLTASVLFFVALFSSIKTLESANKLYEKGIGALVGGAQNVVDPTDLLALPFAALAWIYGTQRLSSKVPVRETTSDNGVSAALRATRRASS